MKSIVRLMHFSIVVLPEFAGPTTPKIELRRTLKSRSLERDVVAVADGDIAELDVAGLAHGRDQGVTTSCGSAARRAA